MSTPRRWRTRSVPAFVDKVFPRDMALSIRKHLESGELEWTRSANNHLQIRKPKTGPMITLPCHGQNPDYFARWRSHLRRWGLEDS